MRKVKNLYNSRLKLAILCVESTTGVFGTASILSENHPYITLGILAVGAISNKILQYLETENI